MLDAAWVELGENGWAGFTIEAVAVRSGTAKSVIYRRWSNRVELAQALLERGRTSAPGPGSPRGELRADLLGFLHDTAQFLCGPFGDAVRGIALEGDPSAHHSVFGVEVLVELVAHHVEQARIRGELNGVPSALSLNLGHAVLMWEFALRRQTPTPAQLEEFVDTVWLPAIRASIR